MINGQRTVAGISAVVAVMLGLNLIVGGASAQPEPPPLQDPPLQPVSIAASSFGFNNGSTMLARTWSDGLAEFNIRSTFGGQIFWSGWQAVPE